MNRSLAYACEYKFDINRYLFCDAYVRSVKYNAFSKHRVKMDTVDSLILFIGIVDAR